MTVGEMMVPCPTSCSASEVLSRVAGLMKTFEVRALPVTDRSGHIVGIVTDEDLRAAGGRFAEDPMVTTVMTSVSESCSPSDPLPAPGVPRRMPVAVEGALVGLLVVDGL